jgi:hypothetical protein
MRVPRFSPATGWRPCMRSRRPRTSSRARAVYRRGASRTHPGAGHVRKFRAAGTIGSTAQRASHPCGPADCTRPKGSRKAVSPTDDQLASKTPASSDVADEPWRRGIARKRACLQCHESSKSAVKIPKRPDCERTTRQASSRGEHSSWNHSNAEERRNRSCQRHARRRKDGHATREAQNTAGTGPGSPL